jgi:cytochrome c
MCTSPHALAGRRRDSFTRSAAERRDGTEVGSCTRRKASYPQPSSLTRERIPVKRIPWIIAAAPLAALSIAHAADGGATAEQATAMVKKGVAFIKANGPEKGYAEITSKTSQFKFEDLYLVVYGLDGTVHAHGANDKMVGRNLIELKDVDGKAFVKERVELGKTKVSFWQDYKFTNPESKKIEPKTMYCERLEQTVVCGGIYK